MTDTIRLHQPGLRKLLGDLEASIMEVVWDRDPGARLTVRDVYEALLAQRKIAYTSVMTVMSNLAKKGVLAVEKEGTAYLYRAPRSREQFTRDAVGAIVSELLTAPPPPLCALAPLPPLCALTPLPPLCALAPLPPL